MISRAQNRIKAVRYEICISRFVLYKWLRVNLTAIPQIMLILKFVPFLWDVNLHLEYLLDEFKVIKWLRFTTILYNSNLT